MSVLRERILQRRCGWFKTWRGGCERRPEKQATFRPELEGLEHREVMSVTGFDPVQTSLQYLGEFQQQLAIVQSDMKILIEDVQFNSNSRLVADAQRLQRDLNTGMLGVSAAGYNALTEAARMIPMDNAGGAFSPDEIRHAYGFDNIAFGNGSIAADGSGQTIAIVDAYDDPNIGSDLHNFDTAFGLPDPNFSVARQYSNGQPPPTDPSGGWEAEEALDVESAHAMAPGANILLVEAQDASTNHLFNAVQWAANQPGVSVVSMSWGGSQASESQWDSVFTTPASHAGETFVAAAGDQGTFGYPASSPNVLAGAAPPCRWTLRAIMAARPSGTE